MTAPALADALGPRARRRAAVATALSAVALLALVAVAVSRFAAEGQLARDKWEPLLDWPVIRFYLVGLVNALKAAGTAMVGALGIGALVALLRLARTRPLRWMAAGYIELFRGIPLLLLILFAFLGLPRLGVRMETFGSLVLGLAVYNSAVLAEVFRAGIQSLDRGQSEAARAIGLGYWATMAYVVIPQAVRRMVPTIVSQLVTLLKDTSLGFIIAYDELLRRAQITGNFFQNPVHALALVAIFYIVVNATLSRLVRWLEARQARRYRTPAVVVAGTRIWPSSPPRPWRATLRAGLRSAPPAAGRPPGHHQAGEDHHVDGGGSGAAAQRPPGGHGRGGGAEHHSHAGLAGAERAQQAGSDQGGRGVAADEQGGARRPHPARRSPMAPWARARVAAATRRALSAPRRRSASASTGSVESSAYRSRTGRSSSTTASAVADLSAE